MSQWFLKKISGNEVGPPINITSDTNVIGRKIGSFIVLQSAYASRQHCTIKIRNGEAFIRDNKTLNGTYIGVNKILSERDIPLKNGDKIGIGLPAFDISTEPYFEVFQCNTDSDEIVEIADTCEATLLYPYHEEPDSTFQEIKSNICNAYRFEESVFRMPQVPKSLSVSKKVRNSNSSSGQELSDIYSKVGSSVTVLKIPSPVKQDINKSTVHQTSPGPVLSSCDSDIIPVSPDCNVLRVEGKCDPSISDTSKISEYSVCDDIIVIDSDDDEDDIPCSQLFNSSRRENQNKEQDLLEALNSFRELEDEDFASKENYNVPYASDLQEVPFNNIDDFNEVENHVIGKIILDELEQNESFIVSEQFPSKELMLHSQLSPEVYLERVENENSVNESGNCLHEEEFDLLAALMTQKDVLDLQLNVIEGESDKKKLLVEPTSSISLNTESNEIDANAHSIECESSTSTKTETPKKCSKKKKSIENEVLRKSNRIPKDSVNVLKRKHEINKNLSDESNVKNPRISNSPKSRSSLNLRSMTSAEIYDSSEGVSPSKKIEEAGKKLQETISARKKSPKVIKDPYNLRESEKRKIRDIRKKKLLDVALKEKQQKVSDVSSHQKSTVPVVKNIETNRSAILIDMIPKVSKKLKGVSPLIEKLSVDHEVTKRRTRSKDNSRSKHNQKDISKENKDIANESSNIKLNKKLEQIGDFSNVFMRKSLRNVNDDRNHQTVEEPSGSTTKARSSILKKRDSDGARKSVQFAQGENLTLVKYYEKDETTKERLLSETGGQLIRNRHTLGRGIPKTNDDLIYLFCKWNPKWIEESVRTESLPPLLEGDFSCPSIVGSTYDSYSVYQNTLLPLQVFELWQNILRDLHLNKQNSFEGIVREAYERNDKKMEIINITTYVTKTTSMIKKGDFVIVKGIDKNCLIQGQKSQGSNKSNVWISFGYVENQPTKKPLQHSDHTSVSAYKQLSLLQGNKEAGQVFTVNLQVMVRPKRNKFWRQGLNITLLTCSNLLGDLKLFLTLERMMYSPILPLVLNPIKNLPPLSISTNPSDYPFKQQQKLNSEQMCAVNFCTEMVLSSKPSIALIHGPPGTGKSITITHILMTILDQVKKDKQRMRLLLCAPSNFAVDQLVSKLLHIRSKMGKNKFNMVRVGKYDMMSEDAKLVSLTTLSENMLKKMSDLTTAKAEIRCLKNREKYLMSLSTSNNPSESSTNTSQEINDVRRHIRELSLITEGKADQMLKTNLIKRYERDLLLKADIVATTLASSVSLPIKQHLDTREKKAFGCCIIDEASQATELQTLVPIILGVDKFILVGDHKQLSPVVLSQKSKVDGLEVSLFERLYSCWSSQLKNDDNCAPLLALKKQYRMHKDIASFPNAAFYGGSLISYDRPNIASLIPYAVFSHNFNQTTNLDTNYDESKLVLRLVDTIKHMNGCNTLSIGIITPYQSQRELICNSLRQELRKCIDVMTVDSAQGQERDVIVLSCVKTHSLGFLADSHRLNVALTRAKHALFITANFKSLKENLIWRDLLSDAKKRKIVYELRSVPSESVIKRYISKQSQRFSN